MRLSTKMEGNEHTSVASRRSAVSGKDTLGIATIGATGSCHAAKIRVASIGEARIRTLITGHSVHNNSGSATGCVTTSRVAFVVPSLVESHGRCGSTLATVTDVVIALIRGRASGSGAGAGSIGADGFSAGVGVRGAGVITSVLQMRNKNGKRRGTLQQYPTREVVEHEPAPAPQVGGIQTPQLHVPQQPVPQGFRLLAQTAAGMRTWSNESS